MHAQSDNNREPDGRCSSLHRTSEIILLSPDKMQTDNSPPLALPHSFPFFSPNSSLVADAYCLLDVYSALSSNPASFGLPADLRSITSGQSEMSKDKQKEKRGKKAAQDPRKEVMPQLGVL